MGSSFLTILTKINSGINGVIAQAGGSGDAKNSLINALFYIKLICTVLGIITIVAGAMKMNKSGGEEGKMGILAGAIIAGAPFIVAFLMGDSADSDLSEW